MDNKVGDNLPTEAEFAARVAQLDELLAWLRQFCTKLTDEQRAQLTRGRHGAEPFLEQVAELAKQQGWKAPDHKPDDVLNDLRLVKLLQPIFQRLTTARELADDTIAEAGSEANEGGYLYYGMAQSMGTRSAEIQAAVRPFAEFLANTRRKSAKKDEPPPKG